MPSSSASRKRRKAKQANKRLTTLTLTATSNHHSLPNVQLQGAAASASHIKMEGSFNSSLQENQRQESSSEDKLSLLVQAAADANPSSLSETQDGYIPITDEQATQCGEKRELLDSGKVEETQEVSKSVVDSLELIVSSSNHFTDATKAAQVDNTLALDTVQLEKYFYLLNLKRLIGFLPL